MPRDIWDKERHRQRLGMGKYKLCKGDAGVTGPYDQSDRDMRHPGWGSHREPVTGGTRHLPCDRLPY